jgi:hypothetical protein
MISYFISYLYHGPTGMAAANCQLPLPQPITSIDHVNVITAHLARQGFTNPIVMGFTRLDDPTGQQQEGR